MNAGGESSWKKAIRDAELGEIGLHFHDLRHTSASWMVQAGVPLSNARDILGHKDIRQTLRYAHLAPDHQKDAMAALDTATNWTVTKIVPTPGSGVVAQSL